MKFRPPVLRVALALGLALSAMRPQLALAQPAIAESTLTNGLHILVAQNHTVPLVAIDAWVRAGVNRQPPGQRAVAHYLEHVIFKGTTARPDEKTIDGAIEDLGGTLNGTTSYDWAHFYAVVPSANYATALNVIADALQHATISQKSVDGERPVILNEVARADDNSGQVMNKELRRLTYGLDHPYGSSITGSASDVQTVTRDQIADFYKTYYVPNNATIIVSGDVTPDQAVASVTKELGGWAFSTDLPQQIDLANSASPGIQRTVLRRSAANSYMALAFSAPSVKDKPDVWVMDVLLTLLGQGGNNRLDETLVDSLKLATDTSADFLTQRYPGLLTINCSFPSGNPDAVEQAIVAEIVKLRTVPVSTKELDMAKQALFASYLFDVQTNAGKADALGFYDMIDSYKYDVDYIPHCQAVTPEDVIRVAQKYLTPDRYSIVTVIPYTDPTTAKLPPTSKTGSATPLLASAVSSSEVANAAR